MGDVAMTVPVLKQMAIKYPDVKIVMLTRDFYEPFFGDLDNITIFNIDLAETHRGVRGTYKLYKQLKDKYAFDAILDLNHKLYSRLLRFFFKLDNPKLPIYRIDKDRKEKKSLTRKNNKIFKQLGTSISRYEDVFKCAQFDIEVDCSLTKQNRPIPKQMENFNPNSIGLAPFAKHTGKILPLNIIRQFIELMKVQYPETTIYIFGGGAAERMTADSLVAWYDNCVSIISKVTLKEEMDVMANLKCMISMDSSAMHMCSLVGTPVVSVWGATHPFAGFLGLGQNPEDVVDINLPCRPCSIYGLKPCYRGDYACLNGISAEMILDKVNNYI